MCLPIAAASGSARGIGARAELMRRAFDTEDPAVIHRILTHLGLSTETGEPLPARAPPEPEDALG